MCREIEMISILPLGSMAVWDICRTTSALPHLQFSCSFLDTNPIMFLVLHPGGGGGHSHIGSYRDVRPEWVSFPVQKPADGCKFLTKNLRMGHNFDIILPGNGWFSPKLNKTYRSLVDLV